MYISVIRYKYVLYVWTLSVPRVFRPFFGLKKNSTLTAWAPYEQAKTVPQKISFSRRYSRKTSVSAYIVNDYADMRNLNFLVEYLRENDKVRVTLLVCVYGVYTV